MKAVRGRLIPSLALGGIAWLLPITGCSKPDDGMNAQQQQKTDRIDEIAKKSDGDWNKASQEERDYLPKNITSGSESAAKMLLLGKAGKLKGSPGGGPPPQ